MIAWMASYASTALEKEDQRVPVHQVLEDVMIEDPLSDPCIGRAWHMYVLKTAYNLMNPDNTQMQIVDTELKMNQMLDEIRFKLPPQSFGYEPNSQVIYLAWDPEFHEWTNLLAKGVRYLLGTPVRWIEAAYGAINYFS